jgi:hypothetical protein
VTVNPTLDGIPLELRWRGNLKLMCAAYPCHLMTPGPSCQLVPMYACSLNGGAWKRRCRETIPTPVKPVGSAMTHHDQTELAFSSLDPVQQKEAKLTQLHETMHARVAQGMPPRPPPSPRVRSGAHLAHVALVGVNRMNKGAAADDHIFTHTAPPPRLLVQIATVQRSRVAKMRLPYTPHLGRTVVKADGAHVHKELTAHAVRHAVHKGSPVPASAHTIARPERIAHRVTTASNKPKVRA